MNLRPILLSGARGDTRRYRIFHLYQQLRLVGVEAVLSDITDPGLLRRAQDCDLAIIHRAADDAVVRKVMARVRDNCGAVIVDTDDLIFEPRAFQWIDSPDFADPVRKRLYLDQMQRQRHTLLESDAVLVSTPFLAEAVADLGRPAWVHRNAFSLEMGALSDAAYKQRRPAGTEVVIGYASGTRTHNRDFSMIQPALRATLERFPQTRLWLIGPLDLEGEWGSLTGRVRRLPLVPWRELPALLAQFDVNLAPLLNDNPFSRSKSEIKFMEAALVGVPTVASRMEAFNKAIIEGENGLLASGVEEWSAALARLVSDGALRRALGEQARELCLANYNPQLRADELLRTLAEIYEELGRAGQLEPVHAQPAADCAIPLRAEQHPTLFEQGLYLLRQGDFVRLVSMIWVQIRRLLAPIFPFRKM